MRRDLMRRAAVPCPQMSADTLSLQRWRTATTMREQMLGRSSRSRRERSRWRSASRTARTAAGREQRSGTLQTMRIAAMSRSKKTTSRLSSRAGPRALNWSTGSLKMRANIPSRHSSRRVQIPTATIRLRSLIRRTAPSRSVRWYLQSPAGTVIPMCTRDRAAPISPQSTTRMCRRSLVTRSKGSGLSTRSQRMMAVRSRRTVWRSTSAAIP